MARVFHMRRLNNQVFSVYPKGGREGWKLEYSIWNAFSRHTRNIP